jgi:hypothetical protein
MTRGSGCVRHGQAHGCRVEPPGQGVGAWRWVNRDDQEVVNDMALADGSLASLRPHPARCRGWVTGLFRIRVRDSVADSPEASA